jgi:putative isomerase
MPKGWISIAASRENKYSKGVDDPDAYIMKEPASPSLASLKGRINLESAPFTDRGSRILVFRRGSCLEIRLAERWVKWEQDVGEFLRRVPMIDQFTIMDEHEAPLELKTAAYPHAIRIATRRGEFWLAFLDEETLFLRLPEGEFVIGFRVLAVQGGADRRGGQFRGDPEHRTNHRNVSYTTNALILANILRSDSAGRISVRTRIRARADSGWTMNITPRLGLNRSVPPSGRVLRTAERRWSAWFSGLPTVAARYRKQYEYAWWILRAGLISSRFFLTREVMIPSKTQYIGAWQWDSYFHALAYRHVDAALAENQLRIMLDHQRGDGMIPDAIHDEGVVTEWPLPPSGKPVEVTKPPLIAWTALKLYAVLKNRDFLDEIYDPIRRWIDWWFTRNDDDGDGIVQYNHPYSSGLDDSPIWDRGMPVESPELNTYLVMSMDSLAKIAEILGFPADARKWECRAQALAERILRHFWDPSAGVFWATRDHEPIRVLTPFSLYPLLTGRMPKAVEERLVRHLFSPKEFWTRFPIPSVAADDAQFEAQTMWRGPTWVNINYLYIDGLERIGRLREARRLRAKTLALIMHNADIYEYYDPGTGRPCPKAASVFGWSSAVFVDLAIRASREEEEV